jgi:hypothetical protein
MRKRMDARGPEREGRYRVLAAPVRHEACTQRSAGIPIRSTSTFFFRPLQPLLFALSFFGIVAGGFAAEALTALDAVRLLPPSEAKNLARIEAFEGAPTPERWHIVLHESAAEHGLREYVVAGGEIVASRIISQFAESLSASDVIGDDAVKVDSDRVAALAQEYARANEMVPAAINYQLKKEGVEGSPVWRVTCVDENGKPLGTLVLSAATGIVVSHDGFAMRPVPQSDAEFMAEALSSPVVETESNPGVVTQKRKSRRRPQESPGIFRRLGGSMQKFFTGKNTISR